MSDATIIIGTAGMLCLLVAFVLDLFKKLDQDSVRYNLLNVIGAALLTYYAYMLRSVPFAVLEGIWGLFALYKLFVMLTRK